MIRDRLTMLHCSFRPAFIRYDVTYFIFIAFVQFKQMTQTGSPWHLHQAYLVSRCHVIDVVKTAVLAMISCFNREQPQFWKKCINYEILAILKHRFSENNHFNDDINAKDNIE